MTGSQKTRARRQLSLKRSRRSSSKKYRATTPFGAYNVARREAEERGDRVFNFRGIVYQRHEWNNGVGVWRRA